jgi:hypothetical protein
MIHASCRYTFLLQLGFHYLQAFPCPVWASVVWSIVFLTIKREVSKTIKCNISRSETESLHQRETVTGKSDGLTLSGGSDSSKQ